MALPEVIWSNDHQALHNVAMNGRKNNQDRFKPGVEGIVLIFSDGEGNVVYEFPFYEVLRQELEPLLLEVSGTGGSFGRILLRPCDPARLRHSASDAFTARDC